MRIAQLVLGCCFLVSGAGMIFGRNRIAAHHRRAGKWQTGASVLWVYLGILFLMNGVMQVVLGATSL